MATLVAKISSVLNELVENAKLQKRKKAFDKSAKDMFPNVTSQKISGPSGDSQTMVLQPEIVSEILAILGEDNE